MARVRATFKLDNAPLKRTYIEHVGPFGVPLGTYITNDDGQVIDSNGVFGIDSLTTTNVDVKVHCQNAVVKVLNGGVVGVPPFDVTNDTQIDHDATVSISSDLDHFRILQQCIDAYDTVFRQFFPFNQTGKRAFPFGRKTSLRTTKDMLPRIELSYPDQLSPALTFVEPVSLATTFPLMHIKHKSQDARLFGDATHRRSLIPHELSHALHFASLPLQVRTAVEVSYMGWITGQMAIDQPPFHNTNLATSPLVAYTEALGLFSERFFFFRKRVAPTLNEQQARQAFFRDELSATPSLDGVFRSGDGYVQVADLSNGGVSPLITGGDDVEGAVYGAIFLDFARRVGLRETAGHYFRSKAISFDAYRNFINTTEAAFTNEMTAVVNTWDL